MAAFPRGSRRAGFTLLELVIVICLVAILASVALERLLRYQEIAEKTAMEATISALRSAQTLQAAARITGSGGLASVATLSNENPFTWLADWPAGYLGALQDPSVAEIPKGSWYFDLKNMELVYHPQYTRFFTPAPGMGNRIRFRVVVRLGGDEAGKGPPRELSELSVRPVGSIRWRPEF